MSPDGFSNLQIINCTALGIYSGNGGSNQGFYNQYQMSSWFENSGSSTIIVGAQSLAAFTLQFLRGGGDEDDGADMQLNLGAENTASNNAAWLQARSNQNSSHYIQVQVQKPSTPGVGLLVVATTARGKWPLQSAVGLRFYAQGQVAQLGLPDDDQCLAIIDLQALFPIDLAQLLEQDMLGGTLSNVDAANIWIGVMKYMGWTSIGQSASGERAAAS